MKYSENINTNIITLDSKLNIIWDIRMNKYSVFQDENYIKIWNEEQKS